MAFDGTGAANPDAAGAAGDDQVQDGFVILNN